MCCESEAVRVFVFEFEFECRAICTVENNNRCPSWKLLHARFTHGSQLGVTKDVTAHALSHLQVISKHSVSKVEASHSVHTCSNKNGTCLSYLFLFDLQHRVQFELSCNCLACVLRPVNISDSSLHCLIVALHRLLTHLSDWADIAKNKCKCYLLQLTLFN